MKALPNETQDEYSLRWFRDQIAKMGVSPAVTVTADEPLYFEFLNCDSLVKAKVWFLGGTRFLWEYSSPEDGFLWGQFHAPEMPLPGKDPIMPLELPTQVKKRLMLATKP